jgi:superfamily II DNA or RNA helicase
MLNASNSWEPDGVLVEEIEGQFKSAIAAYEVKPTLITEHANHEESIRTGGYSNRTLLELVQNAADAMVGASQGDDVGRVEIVLDQESKTLYCANSGRAFSKNGVIAITHAHLSAKRGDEIGRFGLGFKSVLAVSDAPQVLSRSVSFEFNSAIAQAAIKRIENTSRRLPVMRTATLLDAPALIKTDQILADLSTWATTIVRLSDLRSVDRLKTEMKTFSSEFLLFVGAVREVRLTVHGDEGFATSHVSRDLGGGRFKIEAPDGTGDEWLVNERMHSPSSTARREVGEAVSRDQIKVSVALPLNPRRANLETGDAGTLVGQFWSYFPLQDQTSATGFFNAPWSVNDDRTTLLRNGYNREILATLAKMFVELLPRISTIDDPANHLDYLPARGREANYFGDEVFCALVPPLAVAGELIPDGTATLRSPMDLKPLDLTCDWKIPEAVHEAWIASPNTKNDVPHWRCYSSSQRVARLRQLFAVSDDPKRFAEAGVDLKRALDHIPKRGVQSWLLEWSDGSDVESSANALKFVMGNRTQKDAEKARVIPTSDGLKALSDRNLVFLAEAEDLKIEGAVFVIPEFLAFPGIEKMLREAGFRDLDPVAVFTARLSHLKPGINDEVLEKFWDASRQINLQDATDIIRKNKAVQVLVPTRNGGWRWPQQVLDLDDELPNADGSVLLDRGRCVPQLARNVGVSDRPRADFSYEDEFAHGDYQEWVISDVNARLSPGDLPVERVTLYATADKTPGPFSALPLLSDAGADDRVREAWTRQLLEFGDAPWDCEDTATNVNYRVKSPVRWAVEIAGVLRSTRGYRPLKELVASSLLQYKDILPVFDGPSRVGDLLRLPNELKLVPPAVLRDGLAVDLLPPKFADEILVDFIVEASRLAYPDGQPPKIPARVGRIVESSPTRMVHVAVNDEQRQYLAQHHRPYLYATDAQAAVLTGEVGCLRFEDSFAFSTRIEGQQEPERLLDVFTGLRGRIADEDLSNVTLTRAESIAKWVTTEDGVEPHTLQYFRDGVTLVVRSQLDQRQTLQIVSDVFELGLNNAAIGQILQVGLEHHLELLRQQASVAASDVDRIEIYIGDDDLKEKLPKGLWRGLEQQGLITPRTSVAELCLSVYGKDTIRELVDVFRREGFPDVPAQWAGGAATISWLRRMGFGAEFAGQRTRRQDSEFVVPGATKLNGLHGYQKRISGELRDMLLDTTAEGHRAKGMVELPTGAGKTRVATQTILQLFIDGELHGPVLWIAQSQELCEQAVQTFSEVWRGLCTEQSCDMPLTVGRLWEGNDVHKPDTDLSVVVATDAQLDEVRKNPQYDWLRQASAVLVDEGHVAGTSTRYTRILTWLGVDGRKWERPLVGLSATPFKGTSAAATDLLAARFGRRKLVAFKENSYQELVKLGVLARVKHDVLEGAKIKLTPSEEKDAKQTKRVSGAVLDRVAADHARMAILVNSITSLDVQWSKSVLVFTPNVLSAQILAATLRIRGVSAASVSGQTGRQERRDVIARFKNESIQVLTNCDLLTQGFDAPGVTSLYIARPTFSPNAYIQMAGRGLRGPENGGKEECLIVDMADNFGTSDINGLLGFREYEDLWQEQRQ